MAEGDKREARRRRRRLLRGVAQAADPSVELEDPSVEVEEAGRSREHPEGRQLALRRRVAEGPGSGARAGSGLLPDPWPWVSACGD